MLSNVDDQVSQRYLEDSPSLMELSRELHTYNNPTEARNAQIRKQQKQHTKELNLTTSSRPNLPHWTNFNGHSRQQSSYNMC